MTFQNPEGSYPYLEKVDPWSSHGRIKAILSRVRHGSRILDIGTANGMTARMSQNNSLCFYGVEPVEAWAEHAKAYYEEIYIASVEDLPDQILSNFDVVICADVLEHMVTPEKSLTRLVRLQQPGTLFLISVPNVANIWIRLNLLFGQFNYTDRGILDRTHLRFFTRSSIRVLIGECGLEITKIETTPIPLNLINPWFESTKPGRLIFQAYAWLTSHIPTLLGYQFVVEASKNHGTSSQ